MERRGEARGDKEGPDGVGGQAGGGGGIDT